MSGAAIVGGKKELSQCQKEHENKAKSIARQFLFAENIYQDTTHLASNLGTETESSLIYTDVNCDFFPIGWS